VLNVHSSLLTPHSFTPSLLHSSLFMQEQLSKFFFSAVDFVNRSTETLQTTIAQLTENRAISVEEGQKMYEDFLKSTDARREEFEAQVAKILERVAENLHLATTKQILDLQEQIQNLQTRVNELENPKSNA